MKPYKIKLPQVSHSSNHKDQPIPDKIFSQRQQQNLGDKTQQNLEVKLFEQQQEQTQLLKQILGALTKSLKIQSAMFKVEKDVAKSLQMIEKNEIRLNALQKDIQQKSIEVPPNKTEEKYIQSIKQQQPQILKQNNVAVDDKNILVKLEQQKVRQTNNIIYTQILKNQQEKNKQIKQISKCEFKVNNEILPINISFNKELIYNEMKSWIGNLYESLANSAFYGYYSTKQMTKQQSKSYFSRNLLLNFTNLLKQIQLNNQPLWKQQSNNIIDNFDSSSKTFLKFLKLKFPQKKKAYVSHQLKNLISQFNSMDQYDYFTPQHFKFRPIYETLWEDIKIFINQIIDASKQMAPVFKQSLSQIFLVQNKSSQYYVVKNVIDTKLPLNTPKYTQNELQQNGVSVKSTRVLRVLLKWIQSLQNLILKIENKPSSWFRTTFNEGQNIQNYKNLIVETFITKRQQLKQKIKYQKQRLSNLMIQIPQYIQNCKNQLRTIPNHSLQTGIFTSLIQEQLDLFATDHLYYLLKQYGTILDDNLRAITFQVCDLMRARCQGSMHQIKAVYHNLANNQYFKVIRVKNRIDTSNRDFLVNFIMFRKNNQTQKLQQLPLICELQLVVNQQQGEEKQYCYDRFNHFLYELERSRYGSICQAVNIISDTEDQISYFNHEKINKLFKNHKCIKMNTQYKQNQLFYNGNKCEQQSFNFICSCCMRYTKSHSSIVPVSINNQSKQQICSACVQYSLSSQTITSLVLQNKIIPSIHDCFQYVDNISLISNVNYFITIKNSLPKNIISYKQHNGQFLQCMFGLQNQIFKQQHNNLLYKPDPKQFIFLLKKDAKIQKCNYKQIKKIIDKHQFIYLCQIGQKDSINDIQFMKESDGNNLVFVILKINQEVTKYILLDIYQKDFDNFFIKQQAIEQIHQFVSIVQKTRLTQWVMKGSYNEDIFKKLQNFRQYPTRIQCESLMKELPNIQYPNLKNLKLILTNAKLEFIKLTNTKLQQIDIKLNEGEISFENTSFQKLQSIKIEANILNKINFSGATFQQLEQISIKSQSIVQFILFQQTKSLQMKKLQSIILIVKNQNLDLKNLPNEKLTSFTLQNSGKTQYPKFICLKYLDIKVPTFDFQIIKNNPLVILEIDGVQNIQNLFIGQNDLSNVEVRAFGIKIKTIRINKLIRQLKLQHCLLQQVLFQPGAQTQSLSIMNTNVASLDLTNLNIPCMNSIQRTLNLQHLRVQENKMNHLTFRDEFQIQKLDYLNISYINYSEQFIKGIDINQLLKKTKHINIGQYNNTRSEIQSQLLSLTPNEYQQLSNRFLNGLTQQQIRLHPKIINKYIEQIKQQQVFNYKSIKQIERRYESLRIKLRECDFELTSSKNGIYKKKTK